MTPSITAREDHLGDNSQKRNGRGTEMADLSCIAEDFQDGGRFVKEKAEKEDETEEDP